MNSEKLRQIARERARIRHALSALSRPVSDVQRALESVLAAVAAATAGDGNRLPANARRQVERAIGPAFLRDLEFALERHNSRRPASPDSITRELALLDFGVRVLELEDCGMLRRDALGQASNELDLLSRKGEALDIRSLFDRFRQFRQMYQARRFIPYFSIDPETGEMAPTRFVPAHLDGQKGRPRKL